jgi:hypothetical protein
MTREREVIEEIEQRAHGLIFIWRYLGNHHNCVNDDEAYAWSVVNG